ncbi:MAG: protein kinase, partial [Psychromonas sp.]|nr:protein kinase [Psychromonas sp.]
MKSLYNDMIMEKFHSSAYQLQEKIGEGGFGCVYRAKQLNTEQFVAIKFLTICSDFDDCKRARYIERFERETLLGSRLQHPHIVRLLDKGRCGDLLYAVFEYVDGKTLKQILLESGPLTPVETAEIMAQVLDALDHAHQQGVIHRDIKPANIMLIKSGVISHAKVLDFGIGTFINETCQQDHKSITLTQETLGTPSYSAPEQLRGEPPTLKTDLYVWGLVFIECLTGQPTMSGSSLASVFHKQLSQSNVPLPASIVSHPIAALLRRVLQKKAHERSVNAHELYKELKQINFANLVGDICTPQEQKTFFDNTNTLVNTNFDETLIHNKSAYYTRLTERKQITALSINLSAQSVGDDIIDYEVVDTLLHDQRNQCLDTAIRYGAYHVGSLADSILFYFGYPIVNDNDSRLCARSALDIISSL